MRFCLEKLFKMRLLLLCICSRTHRNIVEKFCAKRGELYFDYRTAQNYIVFERMVNNYSIFKLRTYKTKKLWLLISVINLVMHKSISVHCCRHTSTCQSKVQYSTQAALKSNCSEKVNEKYFFIIQSYYWLLVTLQTSKR